MEPGPACRTLVRCSLACTCPLRAALPEGRPGAADGGWQGGTRRLESQVRAGAGAADQRVLFKRQVMPQGWACGAQPRKPGSQAPRSPNAGGAAGGWGRDPCGHLQRRGSTALPHRLWEGPVAPEPPKKADPPGLQAESGTRKSRPHGDAHRWPSVPLPRCLYRLRLLWF